MRIRNHNRRGITLLFVISMIVLFLLMGTTFLIVSNDYSQAARRRLRAKIHSKDATALVHRSFFKLIRGDELTNVDSPMRGLDLLSDQYGYGFKASVQSSGYVQNARKQLVMIQIHETSTVNKSLADQNLDNGRSLLGLRDLRADAEAIVLGNNPPNDLVGGIPLGSGLFQAYSTPHPDTTKDFMPELDIPGYFAGQVLTFVTGPAKGISARIVDYTVTIDNSGGSPVAIRTFFVMPERMPNGTNTPFNINSDNNITIGGVTTTQIAALGDVRTGGGLLVNTPSQVIINGKPFGGLGSGVAANLGSVIRAQAEQPNRARYIESSSGLPTPVGSFFSDYSTVRNALNEPYDAFDHDNIILAQNLDSAPRASFNPIQLPSGTDHNRSTFRPVYQESSPGVPTINSTANRFFPNVLDGPFGTGTGTPYSLANRPLDVDNDNNGVADSVWMDMGHEVITTRDGRLIKPMVAAMVVDLDSRLNVNANGSIPDAQARAAGTGGSFMNYANLLGPNATTPAVSAAMARGLGWGPAEISLAPILNDYLPLLVGYTDPSVNSYTPFDAEPVLPGRYGWDRFPGNSYLDYRAGLRFGAYPASGTVGSSFQSRPMDIHGRFSTGFPAYYQNFTVLDDLGNPVAVNAPFGMPIADISSSSWPPAGPYSNIDVSNPYPGFGAEAYNSPYESSLFQNGRRGDDLLFTPDELEAMLRPFDIDSSLLASRLKDFGVSTNQRHLLTTDSFEVPALPPTLFPALTGGGVVNQTIPERLYNILKRNNPTLPHNDLFTMMRGGTFAPNNVVHSLLPHEVMRGLPMNVNRVFGDGRDVNNAPGDPLVQNGVVDEHWNSNDPALNESVVDVYQDSGLQMDHNNDGGIDAQDYFPRQIFARHLFVLTWLTTSTGTDGSGNPQIPDMNRDTIIDDNDIAFLAQWCANVVDFRDPDSICTPFKYDKNPWDGWDPGPNVTASDPAPYVITDPNVGVVWGIERPELLITEAIATHERRYTDSDSDMNWESEYVPKASVFVELYNPWSTSNGTEILPAELYDSGGVNLDRHINDDPVWRMLFTENRDDTATDTNARRVYFRAPSNNVEGSDTGVDAGDTGVYYHTTETVAPILPNGYAVIGSSGIQTAGGDYRTTFGRRTDADELSDLLLDDTRSISLVPGTGVDVVDGIDGNNMTTESRSCVAIPINVSGRGGSQVDRSLGITDPIQGYDPTGALTQIIDPNGDSNIDDGDGYKFIAPPGSGAKADPMGSIVIQDGLIHNSRFVQLQRLANPLVPFDADLNPYLTVDVVSVDVLSFNGLATTDDDVFNNNAAALDFDSHERGETQNGGSDWDTQYDGVGRLPNERLLWPQETPRVGMQDVAPILTDLHFLSQEFDESFGVMNETYRGDGLTAAQIANVATTPFPWLTWNNRPYASQYELANVPMFRSREVLNNYTVGWNHVVQFNDTSLKRVFDFLEVPPRWVGSEIDFNPAAFNGESPSINVPAVFNAPFCNVSRYRYPGKININTINDDQDVIWESGMMHNRGAKFDYGLLTQVRGDTANGTSTDPIRPDGVAAVDLPRAIPDPQEMSNGEADGSLLRTNASGASNFFSGITADYADSSRNHAFSNAPISRLANISTNRSSVYAIWITVGYFEVDQNGRVGAEIGSEDGDVTRNRGFYIFDRSIPMGFEPGKNHNVERGILVQSIIE